jgi:hypothetical protein
MKTIRLLALLLFAFACAAQTAPAPQTPPPPAAPPQAETRITPQQADELLRSVDEIAQFVSHDTGLPIKHPIKRALASREQVEKYVVERTGEDEDAQRLERSEKVLKRLSLIPHDFDLRGFMIQLLKEQVAGYYNSKDKTVYLLDWVEPDQQKPVLAHELTHALQDQNFGLDKFSKSAQSGPDGELNGDEREAARTAAVEGQGMVVMIDYVLAPSGNSILDSPQLADAIQASMSAGQDMKVFAHAPFYLQKLLLFPYSHGLSFERTLLEKRGQDAAFAGVFRNPPADTHQIMQPADYLAGKVISPLVPPDFSPAIKNKYKKFDIGTLGEFDINALVRQFSDPNAQPDIAPNLRGAYYYAAESKAGMKEAKKDEEKDERKKEGNSGDKDSGTADATKSGTVAALANDSNGPLPAVAVVTHWTDADSATQFAGIYAAAIPNRYAAAKLITPDAASELAVRAKPVPNTNMTVAVAPRLAHPAAWDSSEGPLYVEPHGDTVLVMEGFDEQTAARIRATVFATH